MRNITELPLPEISLPALVKWGTAAVAGQAAALTVGPKATIAALVFFMFVDWVTGFTAAWMRGEASSAKGAQGLAKKGLTLLLILTIHVAEKLAGFELHLESWGAAGFALNELISIVENMAKAGVYIPGFLVDGLQKVKIIFQAKAATAKQLRDLADDAGGNTHDSPHS